jgi:hypothetical protein
MSKKKEIDSCRIGLVNVNNLLQEEMSQSVATVLLASGRKIQIRTIAHFNLPTGGFAFTLFPVDEFLMSVNFPMRDRRMRRGQVKQTTVHGILSDDPDDNPIKIKEGRKEGGKI